VQQPTRQHKKIDKYARLASTHIFYSFAIRTAETWRDMAIELTQEIGRRITTITEDNILVPTPVHGSSKRTCGGLFPEHHDHRMKHCSINICLTSISTPSTGLVLVPSPKIILIIIILWHDIKCHANSRLRKVCNCLQVVEKYDGRLPPSVLAQSLDVVSTSWGLLPTLS